MPTISQQLYRSERSQSRLKLIQRADGRELQRRHTVWSALWIFSLEEQVSRTFLRSFVSPRAAAGIHGVSERIVSRNIMPADRRPATPDADGTAAIVRLDQCAGRTRFCSLASRYQRYRCGQIQFAFLAEAAEQVAMIA